MKKKIVGLIVLVGVFAIMFGLIIANARYVFSTKTFYDEKQMEQNYKKGYEQGAFENRDEALYDLLEDYIFENAELKAKNDELEDKSEENKNLINKLLSIGCKIEINCDIIKITSNRELKNLTSICTGYYPDFPTDLQSMMLTACCVGCGKTIITENLFENRFLTTTELIKMGANIHQVNKNEVEVIGGKLFGAEVYAKDLRGGAALVLASLVAEGTTKVNNVHFIDRGYQQLDFVLRSLGANIRRI